LIFVDLGFLRCLTALAAMISLNPVAFLHPASAYERTRAGIDPVAYEEVAPSIPGDLFELKASS
jgi:hypothetical protein